MDDPILAILTTEHKRTTADIQRLLGQNQKISAVWFGLVAGLFGLGEKTTAVEAHLFVPVATALLLFYTLNVYEGVMLTGGSHGRPGGGDQPSHRRSAARLGE